MSSYNIPNGKKHTVDLIYSRCRLDLEIQGNSLQEDKPVRLIFGMLTNKAGYTATEVACEWAGVVLKRLT